MKINLTKKQYKTLAKTVYLGNWMANGTRTGQEGDTRLNEYQEITDYIFSMAQEFGFSKDFEHILECGDHEETTEVCSLHERYDEDIFWEELPERLGQRDFYLKYTEEERKKMDREEHFIKMQECVILWENELVEYGIDRLQILR